MISATLALLACVLAMIWLGFTIGVWFNLRAARQLPAANELPSPLHPPRVSVIVAARDEEARIEATVRGLLEQKGIELELVVVDDRSRDATPRILEQLVKLDPRLTVVRVDELPAGWLGKCHACSQGAARARGDWLLFTDGDIHIREDAIARAVATAERDQADHLTIWPRLNSRGLAVRAAILVAGQFLAIYAPAAQVNRDRGKRGIGIGAFNLLRRQAYESIGGHEPLRLEVVDDVKLGWLIRRAGLRQRVYGGLADIEAEWGHNVRDVIRLQEKNWFSGVGYRTWSAVGILGMVSLFWLGGLTAPWWGGWWGWLTLAAWLGPVGLAGIQARQMGWPWYTALAAPLGFPVFVISGAHSTWRTLRQGGVRWRDTFYTLVELRAGMVR